LTEAGWENIRWDQLSLHEKLGEGASGTIYRSSWQYSENTPQTHLKPAALKIFKADINSDGMPENEMLACRRAGRHPHLIPVFGEVNDHPTHEKPCSWD